MNTIDKITRVTASTLLSSLQHAVIGLDREGYIGYVNQAALRLTGYESHELISKPFHLLYGSNEESIKAQYELNQAARNGFFTTECWKIRKSGDRLWCEITISPIIIDGNLNGFTCTINDATERKKRELELRESEQRFRLMVEGVKDYAIFMMDPEGYIMTWNEGARRIKGYLPSEIVGKHFSTFYTSEDLSVDKPAAELRVAAETGRYEEEGWRIKKNGSLFWANIVITALFNDENKLIGYSKVTRDLTDRREKEESYKQSEERYRALVEQVTDYGIFMMDEKGRIKSWNEGAHRINGYNADEVIGKYFSIFYPEEDILNGKPAYELRVAVNEGKYEEEGWRLRKDGRRFWANVVITAIYNHHGAHIGFSKVTRDLTERKEAEKALHESYDRYRQLAEQLKFANQELSYTNEELEQFTSIVSHDLQEPVRTIKSFLQLTERKLPAGYTELAGYVKKSIGAAARMQDLIRNLLSYAQLTKNDLVRERVEVREIVNEALANLRSSIESKDALINIDIGVDWVSGDRIQLIQLLQNILSNALKFIDTKRPEISIRTIDQDGFATFSISDNGIGISPEDLHKIFDIFRRLDTEKEYPGTGIGLAICKKIVDRHGGRIWVESLKGQGTTFFFTISSL